MVSDKKSLSSVFSDHGKANSILINLPHLFRDFLRSSESAKPVDDFSKYSFLLLFMLDLKILIYENRGCASAAVELGQAKEELLSTGILIFSV